MAILSVSEIGLPFSPVHSLFFNEEMSCGPSQRKVRCCGPPAAHMNPSLHPFSFTTWPVLCALAGGSGICEIGSLLSAQASRTYPSNEIKTSPRGPCYELNSESWQNAPVTIHFSPSSLMIHPCGPLPLVPIVILGVFRKQNPTQCLNPNALLRLGFAWGCPGFSTDCPTSWQCPQS